MELKIEYLPVAKLKSYERNTRRHRDLDVDNIARSIEKYGFNDAIGIWGDNIIVEGHGRLLAAKKLGLKEVPCVRLDHLTDEQRREYAIAHNATAELSEWDIDILPEELTDIDLSEFDFNLDFEAFDDGASEHDKYEPEPFDTELLEQFKDHELEFLAKKRIIITYPADREDELKAILGIETEAVKVVYDISELSTKK